MRNVLAILVTVALLGLTGCAKVNDTKTFELKPNEQHVGLIVPAFSSGVKVEVKVESDGTRLLACLVPEDKVEFARSDMDTGKQPKYALAWTTNAASEPLKATFPANQEGHFLIQNAGTKTVTVKVTIIGR